MELTPTTLLPLNITTALVETESDTHAVSVWLSSYARRSQHTQRNFKREAERFLMWLEVAKGFNPAHLPEVTVEDVNAYIDFLAAPRLMPVDVLLRFGKTEQPFRGALSKASTRQTIVILHRMFEALRNIRGRDGNGYIQMNPWLLVRHVASSTVDATDEIEKALSDEEFAEVLSTIELMPRETMRDLKHYHRARWIFQLLFRAWLRRDELAQLTMSSFEEGPNGWSIRLIGKGEKRARIIATTKLMDELAVYRTHCGLPAQPSLGEIRPAVMRVGLGAGDKGISAQAVYLITKTIFNMTVERIAEQYPAMAARLTKASAHWMRHTGISHAMNNDVSPRYVQAHARHANPSTTSRYDSKSRQKWRDALETL